MLYLARSFSANKTSNLLSCCMETFFYFEEALFCGSAFVVVYGFRTGLCAAFVFTSSRTDTFYPGGFFEDNSNILIYETVEDDNNASSFLVTFFLVFLTDADDVFIYCD